MIANRSTSRSTREGSKSTGCSTRGVVKCGVHLTAAAAVLQVWRGGKDYRQEYQRGGPVTEMSVADLPPGRRPPRVLRCDAAPLGGLL